MESVSLKLESGLARQIEKEMKESRYSTKTEFIREAIRDKLNALEEKRKKERAWEALFSTYGTLKGKGKSDEEFYRLRHEAGEEFMRELDKRFNL